MSIGPAERRRDLATLKSLCQEAGRNFDQIEITIFSPVEQPDPRRTIAEYAEAGAHRMVFMVIPPQLKDLRTIELLARRYLDLNQ